ncbi:rcc01693 family protein [uncultured Limimaricola sp.]|uniref:rcc01693 family protein n=1 Tax=uncultured Limimaricola sp. TaxID=2211667 RepID=UPI0030FBEA22
MKRLDFAAMMRAGICGLGLHPAAFWALTPAELRLMLGPPGEAPMGRERLMELCRQYPDGERP